jgi:hypothetical protein
MTNLGISDHSVIMFNAWSSMTRALLSCNNLQPTLVSIHSYCFIVLCFISRLTLTCPSTSYYLSFVYYMPPRRRNGNSQNKFSSVDSLHDAEKAHDSETLLDLLEPEPCQPSQLTMQMALKAAEGVPSEVTANKAPPNPPLSLEDKGPVRTGHSRSPVLARYAV